MPNYFKDKIETHFTRKIVSTDATAVSVQIIVGILLNKFFAIFVGPSGMAIIGYIRNFLSGTQTAATLSMAKGVEGLVVHYKKNQQRLSEVLTAAYFVGFFTTMIVSVILYLTADFWNELLFNGDYDFEYIIRYIAVAMPLYALNILCITIVLGFEKYKKASQISILTSILGASLTIYLLLRFGIDGALQALVFVPAGALLVTATTLAKRRNLFGSIKASQMKFSALREIAAPAFLILCPALLLPIMNIGIRSEIVEVAGIAEAGYWEAMEQLSHHILRGVIVILTIRVLPAAKTIIGMDQFHMLFHQFLKRYVPIFLGILFLLFLFKSYVVQLLYTQEFNPVISLFKWQFAGDFFEVITLVASYQFFIRNKYRLFVGIELLLLGLIYSSSIFLVRIYGYEGASMGHCVSYFCYFLVLMCFMYAPFLQKK